MLVKNGPRIKSRRSGPVGNCYQLEWTEEGVFLSDSKQNDALNATQPEIPFTVEGWGDVVKKIEDGALDIGREAMQSHHPIVFNECIVERTGADEFVWTSTRADLDITLKFTLAEHEAFLTGVADGDFELDLEDDGFGVVEVGGGRTTAHLMVSIKTDEG